MNIFNCNDEFLDFEFDLGVCIFRKEEIYY
jgi:hypothetical protein